MARKRRRNKTLKRTLTAALIAGTLTMGAPLLDVTSPVAHAQDWEVNDSDRKKKMLERYKKLVNMKAEESYAFKQLMKNVGRGKDYEALLDEYRGKVEKDPENYKWRMLLGHMLRNGNRFDEALTHYEKAAEIKQTSLAYESIGKVHDDNKKLDEAIIAYEKALEFADKRDEKERILRALGAIALHRRHLDDAKRYFEALVALDPKDIFLRRELANLLIEYRRFDDALEQLRAAEKIAGRNKSTKLQLQLAIGEVYEMMGKDDEAVELYRKAIKQLKGGTALAIEFEERIIVIYRRKNNLMGLIEYYEDAWRSPSFTQLMILSRLYEEVGDTEQAIAYVKKAIKKNGKNADARIKLVQLLERSGDFEAIVKAYKDLIKAVPRDARYRFDLANLLFRNQRKDDAIDILKSTGKSFRKDADVHVRLADIYLNWNMREEALSEYKLLVKLQPREPAHLENLGEFYFQDGDKEKALDTWKKILKVVKEKDQAHAYLGRVYADHNMTRDAIEQYKTAIEIAPNNFFLYRELGTTYERSRQFNDAIATWEIILEKSDDKILRREARQHIIGILDTQGTLRATLYQYERKFEGTPPDLEAGYFLAEAQLKLKDLEAAAAILEKILEIDATDMEALVQLEKVYTQLGRFEKAIEILEKLADLDALRARVYYQKIAEAYLKLGDSENAELAMIRSIQVNANDASAFAKLGDVYIQRRDYIKAAEQYEEAIRVDPRAFNHYFTLAEIYIQLQRPTDADQLYRKVVRGAIEEGMIQRAARRAIELNNFAGTMEDLEKDFMPLMNAVPKRPVYDKILVEMYQAMSHEHIARAHSGDPEVRKAARVELEKIGLRAIKPLLDTLHDDDMSQKNLVIHLLGELGNPNAALPLSVYLEHDQPEIQIEAALALGKLNNPRAVEHLSTAASRRSALRAVRELSTWGLGRTASADAIPALENLARNDALHPVKALAAIGLGRVGGGGTTVKELLNHASPLVQTAAAWATGEIRIEGADVTLRELLKSNKDRVAAMAAWSLGAYSNAKSLEALLDAYWSTRPALREAAALGLLRMAHGKKLPAVHSLWEENGSFVTRVKQAFSVDIDGLLIEMVAAQTQFLDGDVAALMATHPESFGRVIPAKLASSDAKVVTTLLRDLDRGQSSLALGVLTHKLAGAQSGPQQLAEIGTSLAPDLRMLLASPIPEHRWHAASLLGKIRDKQAVPTLIKALEDEDPDVRRKAAVALGQIGDRSALGPLVQALESDFYGLRAYASWGLGLLGDTQAYDALVARLDDEYTYVRMMAVRGLGELGDARVVDLLTQRSTDADPSVQLEMISTFAALGAIEPIRALAESTDAAVRRHAREALQ